MEEPRVPAWKRLGLKLKYAQEKGEDALALPNPHQSVSNGVITAATLPGQVDKYATIDPPSKKRRLEGQVSTQASDIANGLKRSSSLKGVGSNVRKSVSFTPETKEDDGESSNFMQDKWDEEARNDQINDFLAREAENAAAIASPQILLAGAPPDISEQASNARKPKREKREKKDRRDPQQAILQVASSQSQFSGKSKDALEYLQQYKSSRATWKFNKNREVWLLKHILSKSDIPSSYESALFDYLVGMKSENAKARLIDQCHTFIVDQVESEADDSDRALICKSLKMDTTERRLAYYRTANKRFESALEAAASGAGSKKESEMAVDRHERVDRAAKLLESMLSINSHEETERESSASMLCGTDVLPPKQDLPNGAAVKPMLKKRKNRTAVVDISSSEDTSSDSDSGSESDT